MTFVHPAILLLVLLPLGWIGFAWPSTTRHLTLILKALSLAAILAALAEPIMTLPESKTGAVILVDTSSSISHDDLARASSIVNGMSRNRGSNWMKVVPFASQARQLKPEEMANGVHFVETSTNSADGTNFESALTGSMSAIPSGHIPRLVLISDGNENEGSTARAIAELQQLHVPVDTIPLAGRSASGLLLISLSIPKEAYSGEPIPIDLTVESPKAASGTIDMAAEGKKLGSDPIQIQSGTNTLRVHARVNTSGVTSVSGTVKAEGLGELRFEHAIDLKRAKVLYLSEDPEGTGSNLLQAFNEANFDLVRDTALLDKDLSGVQLVVLNNLDLNTFNDTQKNHIEEYVKSGGGLLLIGGDRQIYKEDKQLDGLDRALPAKLAPPKTPEGTCVALIIDKSSSMEGRKIELARLSAIGVVDHLKPTDTIGVLMFDNSYQWAVPMRHAEDKALIKRLISGITPDGGTQISPALNEAYRKVAPSKANFKHIVLLTDGISEEGDSMELAKEALQHQVTISTVGLGQDVNRSYLEKIASTSNGRSYFLNEPQGLEQILLKDVQDYSGSTAVEKPLKAMVESKAEILDGVDMAGAPALKGYARYAAKPNSETILKIDEEKKDPLYVRWEYGLGRAGVFASDAKSRWAADWVTWGGFDKFWINVSRDLLMNTDRSEASAQFDAANEDILVSYQIGNGLAEPPQTPQIFVMGPDGFEKPIPVQKTAARVYHGRLHVGQLRGLFRIRPVVESAAFPEIGLYRQQEELQDHGSNEAVLRQISLLTGGRFNPPPASVFDGDGRTIYTIWQLWPGLLGLAIALSLAELFARKWNGLKQGLKRVRT